MKIVNWKDLNIRDLFNFDEVIVDGDKKVVIIKGR